VISLDGSAGAVELSPEQLKQLKIPFDELKIEKTKELGGGNFGKVFKARYNSMEVAVKEIVKNGIISFKEYAVLACLFHLPRNRYITTLYGLSETPGCYYFVSELVPGLVFNGVPYVDLSKAIEANVPLNITKIMYQVAVGVLFFINTLFFIVTWLVEMCY